MASSDNDIIYIVTIITFFSLVGVVIPFITNQSFGTDIEGLSGDLAKNTDEATSLNIWTIFISILKVFTWSFGDIVWWLDLGLFIPLRLALVLLVARNVWVGGGA